MKKSILITNILLMIPIMFLDVLYMMFDGLILKSFASALFVVLGIVNLIFAIKNKGATKFSYLLLTGLFFAMLGDILLEIEFIVGAILFAVGHVFFFISYIFLQKFSWKDLLCAAIIFLPSMLIITLVPIFDFGGILMEIVCVVYALVISLMVGKAISNFIHNKNILSLLILIGSVLFFFSDFMLLFNVFANVHRVFGILCLLTYYPAEIVLAVSILFSKKNKNLATEN